MTALRRVRSQIKFGQRHTARVPRAAGVRALAYRANGLLGVFPDCLGLCQLCQGTGIPVGPGRGSGAGSLVAYCTRITDIDSIRFGLIFERFLNPERISMPDIDVDFCYNRRGEVIDYVVQKYGEDHVSQIATFGAAAARRGPRHRAGAGNVLR